MDANDVIHHAYQQNPHPDIRFAMSRDGAAIGAWSYAHNRFVMVAGRAITQGHPWVSMPYEILINGHPPVKAEDWIEIPRGQQEETTDERN